MVSSDLEQGMGKCRMEKSDKNKRLSHRSYKSGTGRAYSGSVEATRIIPISASRSAQGAQPTNVIRMEPDPGLIKINTQQGRESVSGGDSESSQRFASEVKYVSYYAQKLAETLGMHQLQLGIVEDREGQTAFHSSANGWHGVVSSNRRSLKQVKESLARS
jgi:hypothetical protein